MVPHIVRGFPGGYYVPDLTVRRDAMAVFIRRGMDIPQLTPDPATFPDVGTGHWAYADVEALADAGVVEGYPSGYYRPEYTVNREQMAVFVARSKTLELTPPGTATFPDVPTDHWAYAEVENCVIAGIVQGYPDGLYRPLVDIDRAQMAVYSYRAFIDPADPAVINGGPDCTDVNPATATYDGWSSQDTDPGFAYVLSTRRCWVRRWRPLVVAPGT
jgi:hypothetical protein